MRKWGLAGLLCLGATAFAQDKTLTLTTPGLTVRNAVTRIAELTDTDLKVATDIDYCTIVLRLDNASLEQALDKIAKVTSGYWDVDGEKQTLRLDRDLEKRQQEEEREQRLERIREEQAKSVKGLGTTDTYIQGTWASVLRIGEFMSKFDQTGGFDTLAALTQEKPASRLMARLFAVLPAEAIADLPPNTRLTYSNEPTRMQRRLPATTKKALDAFRREHTAWHEAVVESKERYPINKQEDPRLRADLASEAPGHILLSVRHDAHSRRYLLLLGCFDEEGRELGYAQLRIEYSEPRPGSVLPRLLGDTETPDEAKNLPGLAVNSRKKRLPDDTDANAELEKWRKRFAECDEDEPIGYLAGRLLVRSAEAEGRQLVALLPDDVLEWQHAPTMALPPRQTGAQFAGLVTGEWSCKVEGDGGWTLVSPRYPTVSRANYLLRRPLADLLSSFYKNRFISLQAIMRYGREQTGDSAFGQADYWIASHFETTGGNLRQADPLSRLVKVTVKLLGSMSGGEFRRAMSDSGVPIETLNRKTIEILTDGVYGVQQIGYFYSQRHPVKSWPEWSVEDVEWINAWPTAAVPNGLPRGSRIKLKIESAGLVAIRPDPGSDQRLPVAEEIENAGNVMLGALFDFDIEQLQLQPMQKFRVELHLGNQIRANGTLRIVPSVSDASWTTLRGLSETDRKTIEKSLENWRSRARDR